MLKKRLIVTLLIKDGLIVQSFNFNKYLPIGRPRFPIEQVARWDVDEIILLDISASSKNKVIDYDLVFFVKILFSSINGRGGIKSVEDVRQIIRYGSDKVCLNKQFFENPELIRSISKFF